VERRDRMIVIFNKGRSETQRKMENGIHIGRQIKGYKKDKVERNEKEYGRERVRARKSTGEKEYGRETSLNPHGLILK
jgi:hypothetical protein